MATLELGPKLKHGFRVECRFTDGNELHVTCETAHDAKVVCFNLNREDEDKLIDNMNVIGF